MAQLASPLSQHPRNTPPHEQSNPPFLSCRRDATQGQAKIPRNVRSMSQSIMPNENNVILIIPCSSSKLRLSICDWLTSFAHRFFSKLKSQNERGAMRTEAHWLPLMTLNFSYRNIQLLTNIIPLQHTFKYKYLYRLIYFLNIEQNVCASKDVFLFRFCSSYRNEMSAKRA